MGKSAVNTIREHGFQAWMARRTGESRVTINMIFRGKRRASVRVAALLEPLFLERGVPLSRWDLLYGVPEGQSLFDYLAGMEGPAK